MMSQRWKALLLLVLAFIFSTLVANASKVAADVASTDWAGVVIGHEHTQRVNLDALRSLLSNRPTHAELSLPQWTQRVSLSDLLSIKIGHDIFPQPLQDESGLIGAEIGIGFRMMPHTSLRASFSMVRLASGLQQEREALAEAGFVLEF